MRRKARDAAEDAQSRTDFPAIAKAKARAAVNWRAIAGLGLFVIAAACATGAHPVKAILSGPRSGGSHGDGIEVTLHSMVGAVNAGDAKRYASLYASDAKVTINGGGVLEGRDAIEEYEVDLLRQFPGTRFAIYSVWQDGDEAVVRYGVNSPSADGRSSGHEGLLFYRLLPSGMIAAERRYLDSMTPMAQLGLLGALPARPIPTLPATMSVRSAEHSGAERANVALVMRSLEAMDRGDAGTFSSTLADDVVLDELSAPEAVKGRDRARSWLIARAQAVPDARNALASIVGVGDAVLAETVMTGTLNGTFGHTSASNKPFSVHRAWIFEIRAGALARVSAFMNGKELAEAVGQWPPRPAGR